MTCLELFSGTGSFGRSFERLGWTVVSLDICAKFKPTIVADILQWDYTCFPRDHFQFVWASPCCTEFSVAKTVGVRDLEGADKLVQRTLDIADYFGCHWAMENPQSGLLKGRGLVRGLPFFDTSYCRYGFPYRKTTRLWSSLALCLRPPCSIKDPCTVMLGKRHPKTAQQSRRSCDRNDTDNTCSRAQLYSIPAGLCADIAQAAELLALTQSHAVTDSPNAGADAQAPGSFVSEVL